MVFTRKTLLRQWWQNGRQVSTLNSGFPWDFTLLTQLEAQTEAFQLLFTTTEQTQLDGALRALTALPFQTTSTPHSTFLPPPGTDVRFCFLWQCTQQRFCFHLRQEGSNVRTNATSLSNQFPCLHAVSIKMFLLILNLNFPCHLPYPAQRAKFLLSEIRFYAFEGLTISPFSLVYCFPVFLGLIGPHLLWTQFPKLDGPGKVWYFWVGRMDYFKTPKDSAV